MLLDVRTFLDANIINCYFESNFCVAALQQSEGIVLLFKYTIAQ